MPQEWEDVTSYKRGERGATEPTMLELRGERVRITVHRHYGCGDTWFATCRRAGVDTRRLAGPTVEDAKRQAVELVRNELRVLCDDAHALC